MSNQSTSTTLNSRTRPGSPRPNPPSPNHSPRRRHHRSSPYGGRRGGNIFTDYGIVQGYYYPSVYYQVDNNCDDNYENDITNAQFKFNRCTSFADREKTPNDREVTRRACQFALNQDLSSARNSYENCKLLSPYSYSTSISSSYSPYILF